MAGSKAQTLNIKDDPMGAFQLSPYRRTHIS